MSFFSRAEIDIKMERSKLVQNIRKETEVNTVLVTGIMSESKLNRENNANSFRNNTFLGGTIHE